MSTISLGKIMHAIGEDSGKVVRMPKKGASFGDAIRKIREEKRLSTPEIQRRTNKDINADTVTKIENGDIDIQKMRISTLEALARGLGVSPYFLFDLAFGIKRKEDDGFTQDLWRLSRDLPENRKRDILAFLSFFKEEIQTITNTNNDQPTNSQSAPIKTDDKYQILLEEEDEFNEREDLTSGEVPLDRDDLRALKRSKDRKKASK